MSTSGLLKRLLHTFTVIDGTVVSLGSVIVTDAVLVMEAFEKPRKRLQSHAFQALLTSLPARAKPRRLAGQW
jgi:hypothetical protein